MAAYLDSHPQEVMDCAKLIRVIDVNQATLELYKAESKEQFITRISEVLLPDQLADFRQELVYIAEGRTRFVKEDVNRTLTGEAIDISLSWSVAPGYESNLSKALVSIVDITERKKQEKVMRRASTCSNLPIRMPLKKYFRKH